MFREPEANLIVERDLNRLGRNLETVRNADVIAYRGPITSGSDSMIKEVIETRKTKRPNLTFVLETTGGYIEVVQRIADTLRYHYSGLVDFIVPNAAMSAGTVLVMSGDSIAMNYYSVLGPIDPQVYKLGKDGNVVLVPALGYLEKYKELVDKINSGAASTAELAYLIERFDPAELHAFEQAKELSKTLLREWLVKYKFKDWGPSTEDRGLPVTDQMKQDRAVEIAEKLSDTTKWHSHGRGISRTVLMNDLNLKIDDFGTPECKALSSAITRYDRTLSGYAGVLGLGSNHAMVHRPGMCRVL